MSNRQSRSKKRDVPITAPKKRARSTASASASRGGAAPRAKRSGAVARPPVPQSPMGDQLSALTAQVQALAAVVDTLVSKRAEIDRPGEAESVTGESTVDGDPDLTPQQHVLKIMDQDDLEGEDAPLPFAGGRPLGATVDATLKARIWAGKLVCLPTLLGRKSATPEILMSFDGASSKMGLKQRNSHVISYGDWVDAFDLYVAVMCQRKPELVGGMLKHKSKVKDLYHSDRSSGAWHMYDLEYRKAVASPEVSTTWGDVDIDVWGAAMLKATTNRLPHQKSSIQTPFRQKGQNIVYNKAGVSVPKGHCINFHVGQKCAQAPCRYSHACPKCDKNHPAIKCEQPTGKQGQRSADSAKRN